MFVWRDKNGRIASVTGSIHKQTLDYLLAEDEYRARPKAKAPSKTQPVKPVPVKPEPVKPVESKAKGVNHADDTKAG